MASCFRNTKYLSNWIVLSSGFTERLGDSSGTRTLWRGLRKAYIDERTEVRLQTWRDDWQQLAELIFTESKDAANGPPRIVFCGYSWGAGYAFVEFANALRVRGLDIGHAVLCDPIYYSRLPSWLAKAYFALCKREAIIVPPNVNRITWFRQTTDPWLRGHDVIPRSPDTFVEFGGLLNSDHSHADDQHQYHKAAWAACKEVIE